MLALIVSAALPTCLLGIHKDNFTVDISLNSRSAWCMCYAVPFSILLRPVQAISGLNEKAEALPTCSTERIMQIQQCKNSQTKYL